MPPKLPFRPATTLLRPPALVQTYRFAALSGCSSCALRCISTTRPVLKKGGGKQEQKRTVEVNSAKTANKDDAHDFSGFQHEIDKATDYLKIELSKLRAGGLDLEAIEALRLNLSTPGGSGGGGPKKDGARSGGKTRGDIVMLGDVAQVVPRGRVVVVMVGEKEVRFLCLFSVQFDESRFRFCMEMVWYRRRVTKLTLTSISNQSAPPFNPPP